MSSPSALRSAQRLLWEVLVQLQREAACTQGAPLKKHCASQREGKLKLVTFRTDKGRSWCEGVGVCCCCDINFWEFIFVCVFVCVDMPVSTQLCWFICIGTHLYELFIAVYFPLLTTYWPCSYKQAFIWLVLHTWRVAQLKHNKQSLYAVPSLKSQMITKTAPTP